MQTQHSTVRHITHYIVVLFFAGRTPQRSGPKQTGAAAMGLLIQREYPTPTGTTPPSLLISRLGRLLGGGGRHPYFMQCWSSVFRILMHIRDEPRTALA